MSKVVHVVQNINFYLYKLGKTVKRPRYLYAMVPLQLYVGKTLKTKHRSTMHKSSIQRSGWDCPVGVHFNHTDVCSIRFNFIYQFIWPGQCKLMKMPVQIVDKICICCPSVSLTNTLSVILAYHTCFIGRGNRSTKRKSVQTQGEHANSGWGGRVGVINS